MKEMSSLVVTVAHLAAACAYAGFQWTVHLVVYRQFPAVDGDAFVAYESAHQRRITPLVGVLFAALLTTSGLLVAIRPDGVGALGAGANAVLLAALLAVTALLAVPEHRRLSAGFDADAYRRLLRADLIRVVSATGIAALAVAFVLGG